MADLKEIQERVILDGRGDHSFAQVSDKIGDLALKRRALFLVHRLCDLVLIAQMLLFTVVTLREKWHRDWGNNQPVGGLSTINFVWGSVIETRRTLILRHSFNS